MTLSWKSPQKAMGRIVVKARVFLKDNPMDPSPPRELEVRYCLNEGKESVFAFFNSSASF